MEINVRFTVKISKLPLAAARHGKIRPFWCPGLGKSGPRLAAGVRVRRVGFVFRVEPTHCCSIDFASSLVRRSSQYSRVRGTLPLSRTLATL